MCYYNKGRGGEAGEGKEGRGEKVPPLRGRANPHLVYCLVRGLIVTDDFNCRRMPIDWTNLTSPIDNIKEKLGIC